MAWRQTATKPTAPKPKFDAKDDDWETDTTYENTVTEKTQRYGSKSIPGSGRVDHVDFNSIQEKIKTAGTSVTDTYQEKNPNRGYGGKYGVEQVMDKTAADFSYKADIKRHSSQTDGKKGFGGEHGIDERAADKSAVGFDYKSTTEKHSSQTDGSKGFGGKYGTDQNVQDKSAVGFAHKETLPKHSSQTDYTTGFGGKHGVQKEETTTPVAMSASPASPTIAAAPAPPKVTEKPAATTSAKADVGNIRAKFENMKKDQEADATKRVAEERKKRAATDQKLQETQQLNNDQQAKAKKPEPVKTKEEILPTGPKTPPPSEESTTKPDEHVDNPVETPISATKEENQDEPTKLVGTVNITALLRQRKTSSSSSSENNDDDEWAADKNETNQ